MVRHRRDLRLAARCARGEPDALEELVDEYYGQVLNFVCRFGGRRDDAADLTQDVFLKAVRAIGSYDGKAALKTWMMTIASNVVRDAVRRRRRRPEDVGDEPELLLLREMPDTSTESRPEAGLERSLTAEAVRRAVHSLPEVHRLTVILRFYHDMSLQEIADVCGCTIGTVGSRLHYAMRKLQRLVSLEEPCSDARARTEGRAEA